MNRRNHLFILFFAFLFGLVSCKGGPEGGRYRLTSQKNQKVASRWTQEFLAKQPANIFHWDGEPDSDPEHPGLMFSAWTDEVTNGDAVDSEENTDEKILVKLLKVKASYGAGKKMGTALVTSQQSYIDIDPAGNKYTAPQYAVLASRLFPSKCQVTEENRQTFAAVFLAYLLGENQDWETREFNMAEAGDKFQELVTANNRNAPEEGNAFQFCAYETLKAVINKSDEDYNFVGVEDNGRDAHEEDEIEEDEAPAAGDLAARQDTLKTELNTFLATKSFNTAKLNLRGLIGVLSSEFSANTTYSGEIPPETSRPASKEKNFTKKFTLVKRLFTLKKEIEGVQTEISNYKTETTYFSVKTPTSGKFKVNLETLGHLSRELYPECRARDVEDHHFKDIHPEIRKHIFQSAGAERTLEELEANFNTIHAGATTKGNNSDGFFKAYKCLNNTLSDLLPGRSEADRVPF